MPMTALPDGFVAHINDALPFGSLCPSEFLDRLPGSGAERIEISQRGLEHGLIYIDADGFVCSAYRKETP